jgi:uncharacterized protein YpuA (DUF1002 family)
MGVFKQGENWFIDFRYRGKRLQQKIGPQKRQAELALQKVKVAIAENKYFDIEKKSQILFSDMAHEYINRYTGVPQKLHFATENTQIDFNSKRCHSRENGNPGN